MKKKYIYLHHQGFDYFLTERELTQEERCCPLCDDYDTLLEVCEDETALHTKIEEFSKKGYDLVERKDI